MRAIRFANSPSLIQAAQLPARYWSYSLLGAVGAGLLVGIPTAIIPNPVFERMVPTGPFDYFFWVVTSLLLGLVGATYFVGTGEGQAVENQIAGGGVLSFLAVGCPVCNKIAVLALGMSGALTYFAPIQPIIGVVSVGLLLYSLRLRLRSLAGICPLPSRP